MLIRKLHTTALLLFNLLAMVVCSPAQGQGAKLASEQYPELRYQHVMGNVHYGSYVQIKGSAFLSDDWINGDVQLKDGREITEVKIKFDAYGHRLLLYHEYLRKVIVFDKEVLSGFVLNPGTSHAQLFILEENFNTKANAPGGSFLQVLAGGEVSFYKLYSRDVLPLRAAEGIFLDEFIAEVSYYIVNRGKMNRVRLGRHLIVNLYEEHKQEMKQYMRRNKLRVRNEQDFAKAVDHLNQLLLKGTED